MHPFPICAEFHPPCPKIGIKLHHLISSQC